VTTGAVFSEPVGGDPVAIVRTLCGLVKQTPAGASIQIAHFVMSGTAGAEFAAELLEAHRRGVKVRVVLDGDQRGAAVAAQLAAGLGTDLTGDSWLHVCTGPMSGGTAACIGDKGQHNKFYLFSRAGRASDVVVQSSANLTDLNSTTYWNNALVLTGDRRLYAAYDSYFADLAAERKNLDYYRVVQTRSARAHFFPKADGDPIVDHLGKVSCRRGTTIRVGMSEWDAYRVAIAERLRDLAGDGCRVQVVYGIAADEVNAVLAAQPRLEPRPHPLQVPAHRGLLRRRPRRALGPDRQPQLQRDLAAPQRRDAAAAQRQERLPAVRGQLRAHAGRRLPDLTAARARQPA
jgi:hypothetical protein